MIDFKKIKEKKILVTGGAGFIGSNLCEKLLELGSQILCLDNLSTGQLENIKEFKNNKNFKFIQGDIRDIHTCMICTKKIDYVLHQAALGSVPRSIKDPLETNSVNVDGFLNILNASVINKVKRFIYAASSSTYGDNKLLPKIEENIGNPLSPYAVTKYTNELYAKVFSQLYDIEIIGLRYFNVYGKKQNINGPYAAVIPKFINSLIKYSSPTINGDGSFSRDFTHINNIIQLNLLAMTTKNQNALNIVYNSALGHRTTILELFNLIKKNLIKYDSEIEKINPIFGPIRDGDIPHSQASIEKAKLFLNYKPEIFISDGIKKTVNWFFKNLK